jgi:hypothetical protein
MPFTEQWILEATIRTNGIFDHVVESTNSGAAWYDYALRGSPENISFMRTRDNRMMRVRYNEYRRAFKVTYGPVIN